MLPQSHATRQLPVAPWSERFWAGGHGAFLHFHSSSQLELPRVQRWQGSTTASSSNECALSSHPAPVRGWANAAALGSGEGRNRPACPLITNASLRRSSLSARPSPEWLVQEGRATRHEIIIRCQSQSLNHSQSRPSGPYVFPISQQFDCSNTTIYPSHTKT